MCAESKPFCLLKLKFCFYFKCFGFFLVEDFLILKREKKEEENNPIYSWMANLFATKREREKKKISNFLSFSWLSISKRRRDNNREREKDLKIACDLFKLGFCNSDNEDEDDKKKKERKKLIGFQLFSPFFVDVFSSFFSWPKEKQKKREREKKN